MAGGLIALTDDDHVEAGVAVNSLGLEQMRSGLASLDLPFIPSAGNFLTVGDFLAARNRPTRRCCARV